jgi:hypothetical protein
MITIVNIAVRFAAVWVEVPESATGLDFDDSRPPKRAG